MPRDGAAAGQSEEARVGILSDFYAATDAEARAVGADSTPARIFTSFEAKGLTNVNVAVLGEDLVGRPFSGIMDEMEAESADDQGPWI